MTVPTGADDQSMARLAAIAATKAAGETPVAVRRFPTGTGHYVFETVFACRQPLVVRVGQPSRRIAMEAGLRLHRRLRSMGVPLPEVVAEDLNDVWPYTVLERLDGTDLGVVIGDFSGTTLDSIAARVADAQAVTARIPSTGRYGYAPEPGQARHAAWSDVPNDNVARSRARITQAGLFDHSAVDTVAALVSSARADLDALPAVPFLHDTTTKNVIVTAAGAFSGLVDVDDLCFGDPRYAAALTLASLLASGGPVAYVEAWMRRAGHRDDRVFRLYVALFLVDFMAEHGQRFNGNQRPSTTQDRENLLRQFGEAVSRIEAAPGPRPPSP